MPTAVVTGANSGIGNAFAQILVNEGYKVIAADVNIGEPIKSLNCEAIQLDVASPESIEKFAKDIGEQPVDLLLNVAGVAYSPEQDSISAVDLYKLQRTFTINGFGPLLLTQALLPALRRVIHPRVAVMSSRMGSISDNNSGGQYAYRGSKAAANAFFKSLAVDLKKENIVVTLLHPGIVRTNLLPGGDGVPDSVSAEEAAANLWRVLMSRGIESTGKWWHRNGSELPW